MSKNLVIVESPAKAKTIGKYLGPDFTVLASYGHVRDLVPKEGAVDPDAGFRMNYEVIERNERQIQSIARALKGSDALILATDPDREGEAISWHLLEILRERGLLGERTVKRVVFHEITKKAIQEAVAHPRGLSLDLINAQQARRALDYLVGFNLSPLLWRKIKRGLSAGRVQSPALRMICEREDEIERFEAREYWTLDARARRGEQPFTARLTHLDGNKLDQFDLNSEPLATEARQRLLDAAQGSLRVVSVEKKQRKRNPAAPFTTSTLQQEASRKLGFTASRTMRVAQQLYEGIDLGSGAIGLITYMRTDSVTLAGEAIAEIRGLIEERYGADNLPASPRQYKTKSKNAQEAHEAVRPTSVRRLPEEVRQRLTSDQARLYELIWKRTVACQMVHATFDTVAADLAPGETAHRFRATGSTLRHAGFIAVYQEGRDEAAADEDEDRRLPELAEGMVVDLLDVSADQHFTEPPPRYTEASLVKTLEEYGIGRPSTYASIISTLQSREYVEMDGKRFLPTDIGRIVNAFLTQHFTRYVDYDFTAKLEDELDDIARGDKDWIPVLKGFWKDFRDQVEDKAVSVSRAEAVQSRELGTDPKSGRPVSVRMGRYGPIVQIGTKDDEEKPRFAGLLPGQKMDQVTLEEALALFKLPRELGETPEGEPVQVNVGRFGPYVKYGRKFASLGPDDDVWSIELPRALEIVAEKKALDAQKHIQSFPDQGIEVLNGRYGPYITDGTKNAKIPKDREPASLTLEECRELLAAAPERRGRRGGKSGGKTADTTKAAAAKRGNGNAAGTGQKKPTTRKVPAGKNTTRKTTADKTGAKKPAKAAARRTAAGNRPDAAGGN
ncbi:DNA topoisomerase I [Thioalkalivibrio nitratireducens DSM 14787]|uniref:DNA topoisomerase 1 n=1 Tax=Thioalkalivibrio nitratireducens (strain DSM 14787 / UNIQEM 213 / ALEN2) TaxID=1255043 RepID=L0DSY1_THIND|nr:DNA topoisomerase I [Thioalkalivibrio nitratireducens]AGA32118.1 DNA topoisomerase I [Thioalkalivibrio nitratireducens DSM 14787]